MAPKAASCGRRKSAGYSKSEKATDCHMWIRTFDPPKNIGMAVCRGRGLIHRRVPRTEVRSTFLGGETSAGWGLIERNEGMVALQLVWEVQGRGNRCGSSCLGALGEFLAE
jgi:hypothetical protein